MYMSCMCVLSSFHLPPLHSVCVSYSAFLSLTLGRSAFLILFSSLIFVSHSMCVCMFIFIHVCMRLEST